VAGGFHCADHPHSRLHLRRRSYIDKNPPNLQLRLGRLLLNWSTSHCNRPYCGPNAGNLSLWYQGSLVDIPPERLNGYLTSIAVHSYLYIVVMMLAKLPLLLFLYRIFKVLTRFRYTTWALGTVIALWSIISVLLSMFSCRPIRAAWDLAQRLDPKTVCYPESYTVISDHDFCNITTEFALI